MKHLLFFCISIFYVFGAWAQETELAELPAEQWAEREAASTEDESMLQQYQEYLQHPLDLNEADPEALSHFSWITPLQSANFFQYRQVNGSLIDIYELQSIPLWDITMIKALLPYVTIGIRSYRKQEWKSRWREGTNTLLFRMAYAPVDPVFANKQSAYPGGSERSMMRYKYQYKNLLQYGILGEKDAGEAWFKGAQRYGFDFYSAHLFIRKYGIIESFALGDYTVSLGQGLLMRQTIAFGKTTEVMQIKRAGSVLRPYHSAGEFLFQRGIGLTLSKGHWSATGFFSFRKTDASITDDSIQQVRFFSAINTSGLHRTPAEQSIKGSLPLFTAGGNVNYRTGSFNIGLNGVHYDLGNVEQRKAAKLYNLYSFYGNRYTNISADGSFTRSNLHVFYEMALHQFRYPAVVAGMLMSLHSKVDFSCLYRNISPAYQSLMGDAFTEQTLPSNEKGFFSALRLRPRHDWLINSYYDFYQFPWLRYRVDAPSDGTDKMIQISRTVRRKINYSFRYRDEQKWINTPSENGKMSGLQQERKYSWRFQAEMKLNRAITIRQRIEMITCQTEIKPATEGVLLLLDFIYQPLMQPVAFNLRWQYVDTDNYDTRIYAYEKDVLYQFSVPAFYGTGYRCYANMRVKINKGLQVWARAAGQWNNRFTNIEFKLQVQYVW
ncbi:MAG: hypothetical protein KGP35_01300 [Bacteroidetes bacterium]|nr:hypothetical protein [Bacteroidota bacterium]